MKKIFVFQMMMLTFAMLTLPEAQNQRADIEDIIRKEVKAIPIALPDFYPITLESEIKRNAVVVGKVLWNDLENSGVFYLISKIRYPEQTLSLEEDKITFPEWGATGAQALLRGNVEEKDGKLVAEIRLYDIKTQSMRFGKRYIGEMSQSRRIAHSMADDIVKHFTGRTGVAKSKIVFCSERDGNKEIYIMDYDGHNQTRLTKNDWIDISPSLSPDGKHIAFTSYKKHNPDLYIMSRYGKNLRPLSLGGGLNATPAWGPGAEKILFTSSRDENAEVYCLDQDGKNFKRLTRNRAIDTSPCWSPTGKEVVFTSDRSGTPQIYLMDIEGANVTRLTYHGTYNGSPDWSPDGQEISYVSRIGINFDIFIMNVSSGDLRRLTIDSGSNEHPRWSPDGRQIVFSSTRSGVSQIYISTRSGERQTQITFSGKNTTPDWSQ